MTLRDFAKWAGLKPDYVLNLTWKQLLVVLKKHGCWITGDGIFPAGKREWP